MGDLSALSAQSQILAGACLRACAGRGSGNTHAVPPHWEAYQSVGRASAELANLYCDAIKAESVPDCINSGIASEGGRWGFGEYSRAWDSGTPVELPFQ